jgi:simple sugar transport system permease protein
MLSLLEALLSSTLDALPALVFAALGGVLCERSGVINIGLEGMMRVGAFVAAIAALSLPTPLAILLGMGAASLFAGIHALLCLRWQANQVVSGMALNLVALAGGTLVLETLYSPTGTPPIPMLDRWHIPGIEALPVLRALSGHRALTYLALVAPFLVHLFLSRTAWGLRLRSIGEKPAAAATLGISVLRTRAVAVGVSGLFAGLGGAALSTCILDRFEQHMPAGLGFMALAAMVFGRWTPLGALGAAAFFTAANALRIGLASSAPQVLDVVPQGMLLALPYALTLLVLALQRKATHAPAALGIPFEPESRL